MPTFLLSSVINHDPLTCELSEVVLSTRNRGTASYHGDIDFAASQWIKAGLEHSVASDRQTNVSEVAIRKENNLRNV